MSGPALQTKKARKIIQIAAATFGRFNGDGKPANTRATTIALCDDGTVFRFTTGEEVWTQLPAIPQD